MANKKTDYIMGLKLGLPVILGFIPVGIAYAIIARQAGFSISETLGMSVLVFAGASQMMAAGMYEQGAALIAIIFATFILNLRHLIMSACVVNKIRDAKPALKLLAAFGVTDESFAIFTTDKKDTGSVFTFLGLITVTYTSWIAGSAIGAIASDFLPLVLTASLGIASYAMFLAILIPDLKHNCKLGLLVIITALCNALLCQFLESSWALILSTLMCAGVGIFFVPLEES